MPLPTGILSRLRLPVFLQVLFLDPGESSKSQSAKSAEQQGMGAAVVRQQQNFTASLQVSNDNACIAGQLLGTPYGVRYLSMKSIIYHLDCHCGEVA